MLKTLKLKVFCHPGAKMPTAGKQGDAGIDAFAYLDETLVASQGDLVKIPLGISYAFYETTRYTDELGDTYVKEFVSHNYWLDVRNRSGVGTKSGFATVAEVGDANYRGMLHYCAAKITPGIYVVENGDKIAQLLINPFVDPHSVEIVQVSSLEELGTSTRGDSGFGSSGK